MINLIICRLSIAGLILIYLGAHQAIFTASEAIAAGSALIGALTYSLMEG